MRPFFFRFAVKLSLQMVLHILHLDLHSVLMGVAQ
jgi:hypothetical protein